MEQFSLEKWLKENSRKVVTRRGNPVRIICTDRKHGEDELPIVFLEECLNGEFLLTCRKDGRSDNYDTQYDLFFADKEVELTGFEKEVSTLLTDIVYDYESEQDLCDNEYVRNIANKFLNLARKELEKEGLWDAEKKELKIYAKQYSTKT